MTKNMCHVEEENLTMNCQHTRLFVYNVRVPPLSLQKTGWSPLFFAAEKGDVATTNLLLKARANVLLKDKVSSI